MRLILRVWRQDAHDAPGRFERYEVHEATPQMSLLELLDLLNAELVEKGEQPVAFDHDCREGICGSCGMMVNGQPHGPVDNTPACLQRVHGFADGDEVILEPFRAAAFPVVRDLVIDRSSLDRIIAAGGYISTTTNAAPEAHTQPVNKQQAERAMDHAACIGCGACVAACPNAAAQLYTGSKVAHLAELPQGQVERRARVLAMVEMMESQFGSCTNMGECLPACPAGIDLSVISRLNHDYRKAMMRRGEGGDADRPDVPSLSKSRAPARRQASRRSVEQRQRR
jgi:succinate dehydrogenase / fumarate reductase, iron-sulfur subunit